MVTKENGARVSPPIYKGHFTFTCGLLFSLIFLLAACPLWGQVNNNFSGRLNGDRLILKIGANLLDRPMLFVGHDKGFKQVTWRKHRDKLLLEETIIESLTGTIIPLSDDASVKANILTMLPIKKDNAGSFEIDITDFLLQNGTEWTNGSSETILMDRSYIERVKFFDNEITVITKRTVIDGSQQKTKNVDFSFYLLPKPMKPRAFDHRMGFFVEDIWSKINHLPNGAKGSIMRWRLEKKEKGRTISDPIKPIVFYFDPVTPHKWKPYIKAGIMEWLPAFEAAGFSNAIKVRDVPLDHDSWHINSINHSMVRWSNNDKVRGYADKGGSTVNHIVDWRSGEILKADIFIGSSCQSLSDDYFVRCAPMDKRATQYPFPDDLIGELIQFVVAHEAGHAFGIKDANYGEYTYPFEKMRDTEWLKKMGHTPSIMTYARHNAIVQPEDGIPPSLLIQKVGPADIYQIQWGYQVFSGGHGPEEEFQYLEDLVRRQDTLPWYRYNIGNYETIGPGSTNEVVDNNDPIGSTKLVLKNMERVLDLIPKVGKNQKDTELMARLYKKSIELWYNQMRQVMSMIGGYTINYSGTQEGNIYNPIPRHIQEKALNFFLDNAFEPPKWLSTPSFLSGITYSTYPDRFLNHQLKLLSEVLRPDRIKRLANMEKAPQYSGLSFEVLLKLRLGLFRELDERGFFIDRRRQEIQSAYITLLSKSINQEKKYHRVHEGWDYTLFEDNMLAMFVYELGALKGEIMDNLDKTQDKGTIGHLRRCLILINKALSV